VSRAIQHAKEPNTETFQVATAVNNQKLILTTFQEVHVCLLIQNNRLTVMKSLEPSRVGGIYVGRVDKITPNKEGCFIRVAKDINCYLPISKSVAPLLLNRNWDGALKEGDTLVVCIIRDGLKTKLPTLSADYASFMPLTVDLDSCKHKTLYSVIKEPETPLKRIYDSFIHDDEYNEVITDSNTLLELYSDFFMEKGKKVRLYEDNSLPLSSLYSLSTKCEEALSKKVWLKSGAYLVIEQTEACVVIDINSGKNIKKTDPNQVAYNINTEALDEIALQMRLRELSGMILIDCINMNSKALEDQLLSQMRDLVSKDKVPVRVHDMTRLGIMEITRKKMGKSLLEQFQ